MDSKERAKLVPAPSQRSKLGMNSVVKNNFVLDLILIDILSYRINNIIMICLGSFLSSVV